MAESLALKIKLAARHLLSRGALWAAGNDIASNALKSAMTQAYGIALGDRHPRNVQQMLTNTSWMFAANRQICGRGSRVEPILELCQRQRSKPVKRTPAHEHPFLDLVANPNVDESGMVFLWRQLLALNTVGMFVIAVEPETIDLSPLGINFTISKINAIRLLEPERVRAISSPDRMVAAFLYSGVRGEQKFYPAAPTTYAEREEYKRKPYAFAYRVVMPSADSYDGQAVTQAADTAINISAAINLLNQNQLQNGLHSGLIFYLKKQGIQDIERFREAIVRVRQGLGKAGEPIILEQDAVVVDKNPLSLVDMQFPKMAEMARQEMLAVAGASDGIIGLVHDANRANMEALERTMSMGTIDPLLGLIADGYNRWLLPLYPAQSQTAWFRVSFPSSLIQDETIQATRLKTLVDGTIYTPNDARAELGKEPIADGDDLIGGQKAQPLSLLAQAAGITDKQLAAMMPDNSGASDEALTETADSGNETPGRTRDAMTGEAGTGGAALVGQGVGKKRASLRSGHRLHSADERMSAWARADAQQRVAEQVFRKRLATVFSRWRAAFQATLEERGPQVFLSTMRADADPSEASDDISIWVDQLRDEYRPWARAVLLSQIERTFDDLGIDSAGLNPDDPSVDVWVRARAELFASSVAATQQQAITDGMTDALADGLNVQDITDASHDWFPNANSGRARLIATTESTTAMAAGVANGANQARAALASPDIEANDVDGDAADLLADYGASASDHIGLQWLSQRDPRVRETHVSADGQTVAPGDSFTVGGYAMQYPGDSSGGAGPEEYCNCRCALVAVPLDLTDLPE